MAATASLDRLLVSLRAMVAPRSVPPAAQWVPEHVRLPEGVSPVPGLWRGDLFPHLAGPLAAFDSPEVEEIALCWATRLGKTTLPLGLTTYIAACCPAPVIFGLPDEKLARRISRRLQAVLAATRETADLLPPPHKKQDTELHLRNGMTVYFGWSGSPSMAGDLMAKYLFLLEADKHYAGASVEADPVLLFRNRIKDVPGAKLLIESTPQLVATSRVWRAYESGDRRRLYVPCPQCGEFQELVWEQVRWGDREGQTEDAKPQPVSMDPASALAARSTAFYECRRCQYAISDLQKPHMVRAGAWRMEADAAKLNHADTERPSKKKAKRLRSPMPPAPPWSDSSYAHPRASFQLSTLYSQGTRFGRMAQEFIEQTVAGSVQDFHNSWLGLPYEPREMPAISEDEVLAHRLDYRPGSCPIEPLAVVLFADVQADHCWYVIRAFTFFETSYLLRYGQVPAPKAEGFSALLEIAASRFLIEPADVTSLMASTGRADQWAHVTHCLIDSGYRTDEVYDFSRKHSGMVGWTPVKGSDGTRQAQPYRYSDLDGLVLLSVQTDFFKEGLSRRLGVKLGDPGAWCLHAETGLDYARQITAEAPVVEKDRFGRPRVRWKKLRDANHYLDCEVGCLAAALALGVRYVEPPEQQAQRPSVPPYRRRDGSEWFPRRSE